jgi:hypothetical protein
MQLLWSLWLRQGILWKSIMEPSYQYNWTIRAHSEQVRLQSAPSLSSQSVHVSHITPVLHETHSWNYATVTLYQQECSTVFHKRTTLYKHQLSIFVSYLSSKCHCDQLQTYQGAWTVESLQFCPKTTDDKTKPHFEVSVSNLIITEVVNFSGVSSLLCCHIT